MADLGDVFEGACVGDSFDELLAEGLEALAGGCGHFDYSRVFRIEERSTK